MSTNSDKENAWKDGTDWEPYKLYRARIQNEYDLMNQRINSFILTQAFLIALLSIVLRADFTQVVTKGQNLFAFGIAFMGGAIAIAVLLAFQASLSEVKRLRRLYDEHLKGVYPKFANEVLTGGEQEHVNGDWAGHCVCIFSIALWAALVFICGGMLLD